MSDYIAIQIWCFSPKASEEDGDYTTRSIHLYILRQGHRQAPFSRHLELQVVQEVCCWRCLDSLVSQLETEKTGPGRADMEADNMGLGRTPAAAAARSTIRRLREIAEV